MKSIKSTFVKVANSFRLILLIYILSLGLSAFLFSHFEHKTLFEGFWWSIATATTIGYGDLAPATVLGRISGIFFAHFWIFIIIPLVIANFLSKIIENKNEFTDEEQEEIKTNIKKLLEK